jgi:hypothetical protein
MGIKSYLKSIPAVLSLKRKLWAYFYRPKSNQLLKDVHDILIQSGTLNLKGKDNNPLNRFGKKCFSQSDEDGISLEIIKRINLQSGTYAEFGVGDGLECNTLIFAALGWKGFWVGGQDLAFDYSKSKKFWYLKEWITLENINSLVTAGLNKINSSAVDVVSLDLDGNDLYLIDALLVSGHRPKLFIVEYNGKFPPPIEFSIKYDPNHQWATDDYFGASLQSFVTCFAKFGYRLICCNALTGTNAFFIRDDLMEHFSDVPSNIEDIYIPQRAVYISKYSAGSSVRTVEQIINS